MVRWRQASRPVRQHGLPVWAESTMLAELHALKLPVGTADSPPVGGTRARRPAKPANYITVMMRRAGSGAVPRIVLSALRLGRGNSVSQIGLMLTRSILAAGAEYPVATSGIGCSKRPGRLLLKPVVLLDMTHARSARVGLQASFARIGYAAPDLTQAARRQVRPVRMPLVCGRFNSEICHENSFSLVLCWRGGVCYKLAKDE